MNRRKFFELLGLGGLAAVVPKKYFDIGLAWQRHESGLLTPTEVLVDVSNPYACSAMFYDCGEVEAITIRFFGSIREEYTLGLGPAKLYVRELPKLRPAE